MSTVWTYWEGPLPEHLRLCMKTAEFRRGCLDYQLVGPDSLNRLLPGLENDRAFQLLARPAHRADYIRTRLVYRYGGIWIDSDMIALQQLDPLLAIPPGLDFACQTAGSAIGCFAARANSSILGSVKDAQERVIIDSRGIFPWNGIGNELFSSPVYLQYMHFWDKWALDEISGGSVRPLLSRTAKFEEHVSSNAFVFHICNEVSKPFFLRYLRPDRVLTSQVLFSKILRRGLKMDEPKISMGPLEPVLDYNSRDLLASVRRRWMSGRQSSASMQ